MTCSDQPEVAHAGMPTAAEDPDVSVEAATVIMTPLSRYSYPDKLGVVNIRFLIISLKKVFDIQASLPHRDLSPRHHRGPHP